ncbi:DoxX family protein [Segniliparus rotundus DSM 44985]|uniref:DoxX family protein n=1 Tax=Segniliparus rotundus (strain ATCC BAA-972 / CDC 1076 / CIP 108378 / DSM 44985 / JCM 13578) TaxID=640132 RepID=D6ZCN3_SEGRD|nr:DoxX family protein [Segniliparus rotundus]ADG97075.1 DoxX family protein [Segniliparus rotundus DSM 44985]
MARGIRDVGLLLARLGFAFALLPHGWEKLHDIGFSGTADGFAKMGVPFPEVAAGVSIAGEFASSILLALGLLTPIAGLVAVVAMLGAVFTAPKHFFTAGAAHMDQGVVNLLDTHWAGSEAFVFAVAALALTVAGPGRFSVDKSLFGRPEWFAPRE